MYKNAVWFSRHEPTVEQIKDAARMGYIIVGVVAGRELGAFNMTMGEDINCVLRSIRGLIEFNKAMAVFGVPSTPILNVMAIEMETEMTAEDVENGRQDAHEGYFKRTVPFYAAWNVQRSVEGGKPTFEHNGWFQVGRI